MTWSHRLQPPSQHTEIPVPRSTPERSTRIGRDGKWCGALISVLLALAAACGGASSVPPVVPPCVDAPCGAEISLAGRLHTVQNGHARYFLVGEAEQSTELLFADDSDLVGGLTALDRTVVRVTGVVVAPGVVQVRTLTPSGSGAP